MTCRRFQSDAFESQLWAVLIPRSCRVCKHHDVEKRHVPHPSFSGSSSVDSALPVAGELSQASKTLQSGTILKTGKQVLWKDVPWPFESVAIAAEERTSHQSGSWVRCLVVVYS